MSTTLPNRANGSTIDASWFNIIKTKLAEMLTLPVTIIASETLGNTYNCILVNASAGTVTLTLPDTADNDGKFYYIKAIDLTNAINVIVNNDESETIEGATSFSFSYTGESILIILDENNNWRIVAAYQAALISLKQNSAFTPAISGLWSTVPSTIEGAINELAAQLLGYSGTIATSGTINNLAIASYKHILLSACTALNGIVNPTYPRMIMITNSSGAVMTISNNSGSAAAGEKIITGTGEDLSLENTASVFAFYDTVNSIWRIGGGSGGGGGGGEIVEDGTNFLSLTDGGTITLTTDIFQQFVVDAATAAGATLSVTPFGAIAPSAPVDVVLIGNSNNPVTILNNNADYGCLLNGDWTSSFAATLHLRFSPALAFWVEISRSN